MPSQGTWADESHSMPGEPSCPERKSVQIRFLAHAVDAGVGRLPRFYECCGCVEIFNRVPAGGSTNLAQSASRASAETVVETAGSA